MKNNFLRVNVLVLIIANSANVFAYLYQFLMGRNLSVEDFGVLTAVNSLGIMAGAFLGVIPYIVSKYIIELHYDKELRILFLWKVFSITFFTMVIGGGAVHLFIDDISAYLNLVDTLPIYLFLLYVTTGALLSVFFGVMQGLLMYVKVSIKGALVSFLKFVLAIVIVVFMGYSYNGALFASLLANIIIGVWVYTLVKDHVPLKLIKSRRLPEGMSKSIMIYAVPVALTWAVIGIITNIDVVLVKHYTDDVTAGEYSVAAVIARIAVFLPGVLLTVLFPQVSQNNVDGKSSVGSLIVVLALTCLLSCSFSLVVYFFPELIIATLFGYKYIAASEALVIISFAMSIVAVLSVIFNFLLAKQMYLYLYLNYLALLIVGGYIYVVDNFDVIGLVYTVLYACISLLIINSLLFIWYWYKGLHSYATA